MRKIFVVLGKASTGKDSLVKILNHELEMPMAISFTTRPKRETEKDGVEYNFITREKFMEYRNSNALVEFTQYKISSGETWYYGLTKEELEKNEYAVVIVNPYGLQQIKKLYGDKVVSILIDADADTRIKRYLGRDSMNDEKVAECCRRFLADKEDFKELQVDYSIKNNGEIITAYEKLRTIIKNEIAKDLIELSNSDFKHNPARFIHGI